ncbi:hypothetical protein [Thiomicrorhabdus sp.]|uniref:hypothetical protein n=1 Tax=Thiomicrorhabdus sp. TaxID=2039724 RepID=UPI0029C7D0FE|nr:hypothetical protein [Thiomicrorhabdus sp.]
MPKPTRTQILFAQKKGFRDGLARRAGTAYPMCADCCEYSYNKEPELAIAYEEAYFEAENLPKNSENHYEKLCSERIAKRFLK